MTLPATDDFAADGVPDGRWVAVQGAPVRAGGTLTSGGAAEQTLMWSSFRDAFPADQYAEAVMSRPVGLTNGSGVFVRGAGSGATFGCYQFAACRDGSRIYKVSNGTTYATLITDLAHTFSAGDVARLEVQGTKLRAFKNGTLVLSVTDATYATGQPGVYFYDNVSQTIDNFKANTPTGEGEPHMAGAKTPREAFTDLRLNERPSEPDVPATGSVRLYVRKPAADVLLVAQLHDGTEVTVGTLVSGGNLP